MDIKDLIKTARDSYLGKKLEEKMTSSIASPSGTPDTPNGGISRSMMETLKTAVIQAAREMIDAKVIAPAQKQIRNQFILQWAVILVGIAVAIALALQR